VFVEDAVAARSPQRGRRLAAGGRRQEPSGRELLGGASFLAQFAQMPCGRSLCPVLHEQVKSGRMLDVRVQVPRFHGDGRADWNVMVTIVYRDWAAMEEHSDKRIIERLLP
jgi:hypothetical protein